MSLDPQKLVNEQQDAKRSQSWIFTKIHNFNEAHNRLKHNVHTAWRYPLPPWGRFVMGCFYFSMPVVAGYGLSIWAVSKSEATVLERFGGTKDNAVQGIGDKRVLKDDSTGEERVEQVGAGGWGGGVHLVTGDEETQKVNRVNLDRFFRKQRRLKEKREREAVRQQQQQQQ